MKPETAQYLDNARQALKEARASDERGRLGISVATNRLGLGDKIRLVPDHCDPTVNLYPHPSLPREREREGWGHPWQPRRAALADHRPRRGV